MFWECFLECPTCAKRHLLVATGFNPEGACHLSAQCCGKTIEHEMSWEEAVAGATEREEAYLAKTPAGRKDLDKRYRAEN